MSEYHILISPTYTMFLKHCQGLAYHSLYYIEFFIKSNMFNKSYFILKISDIRIDCTFKSEHVYLKVMTI